MEQDASVLIVWQYSCGDYFRSRFIEVGKRDGLQHAMRIFADQDCGMPHQLLQFYYCGREMTGVRLLTGRETPNSLKIADHDVIHVHAVHYWSVNIRSSSDPESALIGATTTAEREHCRSVSTMFTAIPRAKPGNSPPARATLRPSRSG